MTRLMILFLAVLSAIAPVNAQDLQAITKHSESPPSRHQYLPPPGNVNAHLEENMWCEVTWLSGESTYDQKYDDGSVEDFALWLYAGSLNAVRFTPFTFPLKIIGARFYVGDGSWPGPFLGSGFTVCVFDDDGPGGLPGSLLDSVTVTVNNYHWVEAHGLNAVINSGDYYIAMLQTAVLPEVAPLGVDQNLPTDYRSYSKFQDNPWALSAYQDFMIRSIYTYDTTSTLLEPVGFNVARITGIDPCSSLEQGNFIELGFVTDWGYMDYLFWPPEEGILIAYAVKALYPTLQYSEYAYSNMIWNNMKIPLKITLDLCSAVLGVEASVTLTGKECPFEIHEISLVHGVEWTLDDIWKGHYDVEVTAPGFVSHFANDLPLYEEDTLAIHLECEKKAPRNLSIDSTGLATWEAPEPPAYWEEFYVWYYDSLVGVTSDTFFDLAAVGLQDLGQLCVQAIYPNGPSQSRCRNYYNCRPPYELAFELGYDLLITWQQSGWPGDVWNQWDDQEYYVGVGTDDTIEFQVASRWEPGQLNEYSGYTIDSLAFILNEESAIYHARIWTGQNAGNLIYDSLITNFNVGQWTEIGIENPIELDIGQELWVGYSLSALTGYPAGCDDGPAIDGYGNMIDFGGWQTLLQINPVLDYNWNIRFHLNENAPNSSTILGFNVFEAHYINPYRWIGFTESPSFVFQVPNEFYFNDGSCFKVSTIYANGNDTCTSDYSTEECLLIPYVDILPSQQFQLSVHPMPARSHFQVISGIPVTDIVLYDLHGRSIFRKTIDEMQFSIDASKIAAGSYILKAYTREGVFSRKIILID